ncbi:MAG TPA: hypothetical protein VEA80_06690 [Vitreimonas sp.]|nr:hypothetical protein [Vitreimonas sp.]
MLAAAGFSSPHAAAVAAGSPDMLRDLARGKSRVLRTDSLAALANTLGRSMEDVSAALELPGSDGAGRLRVDEHTPQRAPVRSGPLLPVRYVVQAGAWIEVDDLAQERLVSPPVTADPGFPPDAQWLELVRGDSADLYYPEGVFVHVVDAVAIGYAPRHDDFVVVERKREQGGLIERSLKQIFKKGRKVELWPRSRNPKWKAPLDFSDSAEEDLIEIAALVLGGYLPARR